jgi:hypothetical protein
MIEVVRVYAQVEGKEVCIKEADEIVRMLTNPVHELDLDYHDARGHAKAGSSQDLVGQIVKVGELQILINEH